MYEVFTKLLNMSLTASILVLIIIVLRFALKKAPKKYICILWALVAVRLICPFSISSVFSAYNMLHQNTISSGQVEYFEYNGKTEKPQLTFEVPALVNDNYSPDSMTIGTKASGVYMPTVVYIWAFGVIAMIAYAAVSYAGLRKEVKASIKKDDNIYVCDEISTPFILGIVRPRIYLPSGISEEVRVNVVAHEKAHIKRLDHIWKPLGYMLLSVYWFNPVMWIAYIFLCKDIEAACDEKVISKMGKEQIASYSQALLACAAQRRLITACPVAFGETDVKGRIKNVLNYKKPAFWIICISVIVCIVVAICFLTNPKEEEHNVEVTAGLYTYNDPNKNPMFYTAGLSINDDGSFTFSPSVISSYMGAGNWEINGEYITFTDQGMGDNRKIVFLVGEGSLFYDANRSAVNSAWGLPDGAKLIYQEETSLLEYLADLDEVDSVFTEVPEMDQSEPDSKSDGGIIVSTTDITDELIFNFSGRYFMSDAYEEPIHEAYTPVGWYMLGGEGKCIDPAFPERETFEDGKLIAYNWLDNHSECRNIMNFSAGEYSCCLYQYSFDLFTAADLEKYPNTDSTSEYWVVFYTEGEGKPLYIKYFNCDYFTREQAIESIAPGMANIPYTFEIIGNAEEASEHARLSCLDENGNLVWEYLSEEVYVSELDVIQNIGLFDQGYVFMAGGKVYCIETRGKKAGTVKWVNTKFNGASACSLWTTETEDILYLTGYYGPDLMAIDLNTGATKARYEKLDYSEIPGANSDEFIYPFGINWQVNGIEISYDYNRKTAVVDPETGKVVSIYSVNGEADGVDKKNNAGEETTGIAEYEVIIESNGLAGSRFVYDGVIYDVADQAPAVYSTYASAIIGDKILWQGDAGSIHNAVYCIFNTKTRKFDKTIIGSALTWYDNDVSTIIYVFWDTIRDYDGNVIATIHLDEGSFIDYMQYMEDRSRIELWIQTPTGREKKYIDLNDGAID